MFHRSLNSCVSVLAASILVAAVSACDKYAENPGADLEDGSYVLIIGEPSGESLMQMPGFGEGPVFFADSILIDLSDEYSRLGVSLVQIPDPACFDMADIYSDRSVSPSATVLSIPEQQDSLFACIQRAGFRPTLQICDSYYSYEMLSNTSADGGGDPAEYPSLALVELVQHFGDTEVWGEDCLDGVEIINLQTDSSTASDRTLLNGYFISAVQAIQIEFPDLPVGGGGFIVTEEALADTMFRSLFRQLEESAVSLDFITFRINSPDLDMYRNIPLLIRDIMGEYGMEDIELHLTGMNMNLAGQDDDATCPMDMPQGAASLTSILLLLQEADVTNAYITPIIDRPAETGFVSGAGLFEEDGSPRLTAEVLLLWKHLLDHPARVDAGVTRYGEDECPIYRQMNVIAGEDREGELAILIVSMSGDSSQIKLEYLSRWVTSGANGVILKLDPLGDSLITEPFMETSIHLGPYETLLVLTVPVGY